MIEILKKLRVRDIVYSEFFDFRYKNGKVSNGIKAFATFSFDTAGAKEKVYKKKTPRGISPSADGEEGSAPSTAQAFKKA